MKQSNEVWLEMFEYLYRSNPNYGNKKSNFCGWYNSYNRQPIPEKEMLEWKRDIVMPLKALNPKKILEVGCGNGMIMFDLLKECKHYVATDFSNNAIQNLKEITRNIENVEVYRKSALELKNLNIGKFDLIIVNSVIQYFNSLEELKEVIEILYDKVDDKGCIFIGDVRNEDWNMFFYTSIIQYQAKKKLSLDELNMMVEKRKKADPELSVSPSFFMSLEKSLPRLQLIQNRIKISQYLNEMVIFRYNVFLWFDKRVESEKVILWENNTPQINYKILLEESNVNIRIQGVPNKRLKDYINYSERLLIEPNDIYKQIMLQGIIPILEISKEKPESHFDIILNKNNILEF